MQRILKLPTCEKVGRVALQDAAWFLSYKICRSEKTKPWSFEIVKYSLGHFPYCIYWDGLNFGSFIIYQRNRVCWNVYGRARDIFICSYFKSVRRTFRYYRAFFCLRPRTHGVKKVPESHKFESNLTQSPRFLFKFVGPRYFFYSMCTSPNYPTSTFQISKLYNPSHDVLELRRIRRSRDFEALKLWKDSLGTYLKV